MCLSCVTTLQQDRTLADAALWNSFRGGQRRTTQTVPLRFAAAVLLRYCAYSIDTRPLPRPPCIKPLHPRPSTSPKAGD